MSILTRNNRCKYLCITLFTLLAAGCKQPQSLPRQISPPTLSFTTGDLAFRLGRTLQSSLIASSADDSIRYSHVGVILFRNDSCLVVHIEPKDDDLPDEIRCEPIADFFSPQTAVSGCVMRHDSLTTTQQDRVAARAIELFNSKILFDHDYLLSDTEEMYCTELVESIFSSGGISLSQGRRHTLPLVAEPLILPSDIAQNGALTTIWRFSYSDLRPAR